MTDDVTGRGIASSGLLLDSRSRAMLRRTDPFEVREAYVWAGRVAGHPRFQGKQVSQSRLIEFAPVAALVREETGDTLGTSLRRARVNERHVRRLLASNRADVDEQLAKIVRLVGKKANIAELVATSIFWGDRTVRAIAMDYFGSDEQVGEAGANQ